MVTATKVSATKTKKKPPAKPLTLSQLRVEIAKDVIAQIKMKTFEVSPGNYITTSLEFRKSLMDIEIDSLPRGFKIKNCEACAIGATFISVFNKNNALSTNDLKDVISDDNEMVAYLSKPENGGFSSGQLRLMEIAFEGREVCESHRDTRKALEFYQKHGVLGSGKLLIAIMKNVIKNKGEFIP